MIRISCGFDFLLFCMAGEKKRTSPYLPPEYPECTRHYDGRRDEDRCYEVHGNYWIFDFPWWLSYHIMVHWFYSQTENMIVRNY